MLVSKSRFLYRKCTQLEFHYCLLYIPFKIIGQTITIEEIVMVLRAAIEKTTLVGIISYYSEWYTVHHVSVNTEINHNIIKSSGVISRYGPRQSKRQIW